MRRGRRERKRERREREREKEERGERKFSQYRFLRERGGWGYVGNKTTQIMLEKS